MAKPMLPKAVFPVASGLAIFFGQIIDEKTAIPLFTGIGAMVVVAGLIWKMGRQYQIIVDELKELKEQKSKTYDDTSLKIEVSGLKTDVNALKFEVTSLKTVIDRLSLERAQDMQHLRSQLRTGAILEPMQSERRILIVDDDRNDIEMFRRRMLYEFEIDSAGTLAEANVKLRQQQYDCVLLDLKLPDAHSSRSTVAEFISDNPDQLCIVLTGNDSEVVRTACFEQGADDVWVKGRDDADIKVVGRRLLDAIWRRRRK